MDEQAMELAMTIVAQAGDARSSCMEAIAFAKKGQFEQAEQTLQQARSRLSAVHEIQTDLIRAEVEQARCSDTVDGACAGSSYDGDPDVRSGKRILFALSGT